MIFTHAPPHFFIYFYTIIHLGVVDPRHTPAHARREVSPGRPQADHVASGHVLAPVVSDALHNLNTRQKNTNAHTHTTHKRHTSIIYTTDHVRVKTEHDKVQEKTTQTHDTYFVHTRYIPQTKTESRQGTTKYKKRKRKKGEKSTT